MPKPTALALTALLGLLGCVTSSIHELPWVEVRTPHFVLLSPMPEAAALELARDLVLFRSVVELATGHEIPASPVPVRVYAFGGRATYGSFALPGVAGYLTALRDGVGNAEAVRRSFGDDGGTLGHRLAQYLTRKRLSHLVIDVERFDLGTAPEVRRAAPGEVARALGWLSNELEKFGQAQGYYAAALAETPGDVRAWKLDDTIPESYAGYGATFLLKGQDAVRGQPTLEHAHRLLPSSTEVKLSLARLYARIDRLQEARELARVVSTWFHSQQQAAEIEKLLEEIEAAPTEAEVSRESLRPRSRLAPGPGTPKRPPPITLSRAPRGRS
ncbi:MAG: tetratricopeptide repeat protein [Planctomycetota bacterium]